VPEAVQASPTTEFLALQSALAGRYSLERELGRGGMGIVFLARDVALDRPVAIKLLPPAMAAQQTLKERFLREAQMAAKLSHPNIIPIFAVEAVQDFVFFVMAYVDGETLGQRIREQGPLTPAAATRMLQEVSWALAYAHARGIIHRDVKPDNILLEKETGRALVGDFGIARLTATSGGTGVGEVLGTAQFMSPEQACGEPVDARSDLYALGVVGYYALSGRLPFDAPDVAGMLAQHIAKPPTPLASIAPGIPKRLGQAIDRCLAKKPEDRFPSGEALAEAVALTTAITRETPTPIRVWLAKGSGGRVALSGWTALMALGFIGETMGAIFGAGDVDFDTLIWAAVPWAVFLLYRAHQTHRLLASGYGLDDVRAALREYAERRKEELAYDLDREPPFFAKAIRWLSFAMLAVAAGTGVSAVLIPGAAASIPLLVTFGVACGASVGLALLGRIFPGRRLQAKDSLLEYRTRLWNGRVGEWAVRLAGIGLDRAALSAATAHRPTELVIGLAADQLFNALPKETRKELKDLPDLIRRLEADAAVTRQRVGELNEALAGLGGDSRALGSAALRGGEDAEAAIAAEQERLKTDLLAARDLAARRLATAVAALENIRLDLLRLKAGAGTVDDLSADLTLARGIAEEIDAAIAGRREAERLLEGGARAG
jgi:serine/threonine-protein kinase